MASYGIVNSGDPIFPSRYFIMLPPDTCITRWNIELPYDADLSLVCHNAWIFLSVHISAFEDCALRFTV